MFYTRTEAYCISWGNYVKQILTPYTTVEIKTFHIYSTVYVLLYCTQKQLLYSIHMTIPRLQLYECLCLVNSLRQSSSS